jgi:pyrimidine operon attenuation protein/uracil phosphoribosyltransferase
MPIAWAARSRALPTRFSSATAASSAWPWWASARRGDVLAKRLAGVLEQITRAPVRTGALDITLYRDDLMRHAVGPQPLVRRTEIPFRSTTRRSCSSTTCSTRAHDPRGARRADRFRPPEGDSAGRARRSGARELPIKADYVGKNVPTSLKENRHVRLTETDGADEVSVNQAQ